MKVWTQYAPHLKHIFLQGFEKGPFYISNPTHCENREVVGGISPPWLKSFKNGGEFTPGGDITPLSFLSNLRRGGYHHLFRKLCKMGGISHLGGISPPCPYMASVNGCPINIISRGEKGASRGVRGKQGELCQVHTSNLPSTMCVYLITKNGCVMCFHLILQHVFVVAMERLQSGAPLSLWNCLLKKLQ